VPGFSFVIARKAALEKCQLLSRSLSLDLYAQWREFESSGQFRFTPPTHALLAFHRALLELEAEGGVQGRAERYRRSHRALMEGMRALGFLEYLPPEHQSAIITSFHYPDHPHFDFANFYRRLSERGFVIYPGKISRAECFRIGTIGRIDEQDVRDLVAAVEQALVDMGAPPRTQGQDT
jgi:2-aminoethylphosphonate-pyruvate transaminase